MLNNTSLTTYNIALQAAVCCPSFSCKTYLTSEYIVPNNIVLIQGNAAGTSRQIYSTIKSKTDTVGNHLGVLLLLTI